MNRQRTFLQATVNDRAAITESEISIRVCEPPAESDETLAGVESRTLAGANAQINHSLEGGMRTRRVRVHFRLSNLQKLGRGGLLGEQ